MGSTRVFAISGFSGSGKTTLLSKLIGNLREKGKTVAVIKSSKEDILAPISTDTRKHQNAGADPVILLGPNTTTSRYRTRKGLIELLNDIETDYLLLEGYKKPAIPRFWCISDNEEIPDSLSKSTKAIVGWNEDKPESTPNDIPYHVQSDVEQLLVIMESQAITSEEVKSKI